MRKWRERERMMAPSSQMLTHGGILTRDWFSDKLVERQVEINQHRWTRHRGTYMEIVLFLTRSAGGS